MLCSLCQLAAYANWIDNIFSTGNGTGSGCCNYSLTTNALYEMNLWVMEVTLNAVAVVYAIASIVALYAATTIYVKMQTGDSGFSKSVIMLVGSCIFLLSATYVMPAFFGYNTAGGGGWSWSEFFHGLF